MSNIAILNKKTVQGNVKVNEDMKAMVMGRNVLPKSIDFKDIDTAMLEFVDNNFTIKGLKEPLNTYLFTQQRLNEFSKTWENLDENNNLIPNFKIVSRETNPKKGDIAGDSYNIPGDHFYSLGVFEEMRDGKKFYISNEMKQPYAVNLIYDIKFITNKNNLLNRMNNKVNEIFKALQSYLNVHGHYMDMTLEDIGDESEYNINERKFFVQNYNIELKAYIINDEDIRVRELPSKVIVGIETIDKFNKLLPKKTMDNIKIIIPKGFVNNNNTKTKISNIDEHGNEEYETTITFKSDKFIEINELVYNENLITKIDIYVNGIL